ncbi:MAG: TRAP transporter small permease [Desulfobacterales bacterium]|nr:MAG: TRAP transporter small permease [Desulfobacterales bacterium]
MGNGLPKASIKKIAKAIDNVFRKYELFLLAAGTGATAVLLVADVFARNFFMSIYYSDELAQIFTIYTVFGGVGYAVRKARHIRMGALHDLLPHRSKKALTIAIALASAGVMLVFSYLSVFYLIDVIEMQHKTPALNLPYWIVILIVPVGFFLAGMQYLLTVTRNLIEKDVWATWEQKAEYED